MRVKRPLLVFFAILALLVTGSLLFIRSARFARMVKSVAARHLPADLGIDGDFSGLAIRFFPPGISIRQPRVSFSPGNVAGLPAGSQIHADELDLNFRLFQAFSGKIQAHEVIVSGGEINVRLNRLVFGKSKKKDSRSTLGWEELLQLRTESLVLRDCRLNVAWDEVAEKSPDKQQGKAPAPPPKPLFSAQLLARTLAISQWTGVSGPGYALTAELSDIEGDFPESWPVPRGLSGVELGAHVSASGASLDSLRLTGEGFALNLSGAVHGNVLAAKELSAEALLNGEGELEKLAALFPSANPLQGVGGRVRLEAKARLNLLHPVETLKIEGKLGGQDLRYREWSAEKASLEAGWSSAGKAGGELSVTQATVSSPERPRVGPNQSGSGGKIVIGAFRLPIGLPARSAATKLAAEKVEIPITLERVHLQWLAAPDLKQLYPLQFRMSGPVKAALKYQPGGWKSGGWQLDAGLTDFRIDDFSLDNQKVGVFKAKLTQVLSIPHIVANGSVHVDPSGIRPDGFGIAFGRSKASVTGRIDFNGQLGLVADSEMNLDDVGRLADNVIQGAGTIKASIHGPSSAVIIDFDSSLKDTYYLGMRFGDMLGRITWDDDPDHLIFTNVRFSKGATTHYVGNGMIDLGKVEKIALSIHVPDGDISDFNEIFHEKVDDIWWFPRAVSGPVKGNVQLSGAPQLSQLVVAADLVGTNWAYYGERFKIVSLRGGYDRGRYYLSEIDALKNTGRISGHISLDADQKLDWDARTSDFGVSDFNHVSKLDVPLRGKIDVRSSGSGRRGIVKSNTSVSVTGFSVRGTEMPASQLTISSQAGVLTAKGSALGGQGTAELGYDDSHPGAKSFFKGELTRLDFTPILLMINPTLMEDRALQGFVSGRVNLSFPTGALQLASGRIEISEYLLARSLTKFYLAHPVAFDVKEGTFDLRDLRVRGNSGEAGLQLEGNRGAIEGSIFGDLDISIAEFFTSVVGRSSGTAALDFALGGTLIRPEVYGHATFSGASATVTSLDSPIENITGEIQVRQGLISVQDVEADLAGGRVSADGTIKLYPDRYPEIALTLSLSGNKLKFYPFQFLKIAGTVNVKGSDAPYLVEGQIHVDSALSKEKVLGQKQQGEGLKAAQYTPPPTSRTDTDFPLFKLKIDVTADRNLLVQNDLFDMELKGQVTVVNTLEAPRLVGTAEVVQGRMTVKDRTFQIQAANATFDSPTQINPAFSLTAVTEVSGVKIQLYASGRLDQWKPEFTSNPVMSEPDILNLLALGLTSTDAQKLRASDRSTYEQSQAASLFLDALDFNRDVKSKTGFEIQFDETVNNQLGNSVFRPQSQNDAASAPKIVIKRKIGERLDLSVGRTVGIGGTTATEVNAEYKLIPGLSVLGVYDTYDLIDNINATTDIITSYGVDLKVEKRFK